MPSGKSSPDRWIGASIDTDASSPDVPGVVPDAGRAPDTADAPKSSVDAAALEAQKRREKAKAIAEHELRARVDRLMLKRERAAEEKKQRDVAAIRKLSGVEVEPPEPPKPKEKKGWLGTFGEKLTDVIEPVEKFAKKHPFWALPAQALIAAPFKAVGWSIKKADHLSDWLLKKIEDSGDKQAPGLWKSTLDALLWPIEKHTGRQMEAQADVEAKEARGEKKAVESTQRKSARK